MKTYVAMKCDTAGCDKEVVLARAYVGGELTGLECLACMLARLQRAKARRLQDQIVLQEKWRAGLDSAMREIERLELPRRRVNV